MNAFSSAIYIKYKHFTALKCKIKHIWIIECCRDDILLQANRKLASRWFHSHSLTFEFGGEKKRAFQHFYSNQLSPFFVSCVYIHNRCPFKWFYYMTTLKSSKLVWFSWQIRYTAGKLLGSAILRSTLNLKLVYFTPVCQRNLKVGLYVKSRNYSPTALKHTLVGHDLSETQNGRHTNTLYFASHTENRQIKKFIF